MDNLMSPISQSTRIESIVKYKGCDGLVVKMSTSHLKVNKFETIQGHDRVSSKANSAS